MFRRDTKNANFRGVIAGIAFEYDLPVWALRTVFVLIIVPWVPFLPINSVTLITVYFILGISVPTMEEEDAKVDMELRKRDAFLLDTNNGEGDVTRSIVNNSSEMETAEFKEEV